MNNLTVNSAEVLCHSQEIIASLLTNQHQQGTLTDTQIQTIYTSQSISKMASNLFSALNSRNNYTAIYTKQLVHTSNIIMIKEFDEFRTFCIHLFTSDLRVKPNNNYDKIKLAKSNCQYCHVKSVNGLDHFFDKQTIPELSVFPDNLIPVCTNCNSQKNTKGVTFAYPYLSFLQNPAWLKCTVNANETFSFHLNSKLAKNKFETNILSDLKEQFQLTKAFDEYIKKGQALVTDRITDISQSKSENTSCSHAKKRMAKKNMRVKQIFLKDTEFYKIAILDGIIDNFEDIWNSPLI